MGGMPINTVFYSGQAVTTMHWTCPGHTGHMSTMYKAFKYKGLYHIGRIKNIAYGSFQNTSPAKPSFSSISPSFSLALWNVL